MDTNIASLLHRYLGGETTQEENRRVETLREEDPQVARFLEDAERTRSHLRRSVREVSVPEELLASVRRATIESEDSVDSTKPGSNVVELADRGKTARRTMRTWYAIAAALLLLLAGWFALQQFSEGDRNRAGDAQLAEALGPAHEMLRIGMTDHLKCAVTFYKGDVHPYSLERMRRGLGESFEGLIPIVEQKVTEGTLVVAHTCSFDGRQFVHMIVKGNDNMISLVITRRRENESLTNRSGDAIDVSGTPVYHARIEDFDIAGFDAGEFMVFVASDLDTEANLNVATEVLQPVSDYLRSVRI